MKILSGSSRDKVRETPKQNKWKQGSFFNKKINAMTSNGMSVLKAELFAGKMRDR